ncbi:MAG: aldehyde dehydrogenase family protein [Bdellovibrionaceae bacterium]|nr:aldehyde dehydrogenase family protein [Pseudobdellovibrionaceae bacterium]
MFQTINPATGEVVKSYNYKTLDEVDQILASAEKSFQKWRKTTPAKRALVLKQLATRFREHKRELGQLMHEEMGKSVADGIAEAEKCAAACDYFAEQGEGFLRPQMVSANYAHSEIRFEPLGVIFSIMPWNFPFWQFVRFAAPSLMIGNVIVLKHADLTAGCGAKIEELCEGLFDVKLIYNLHIDHSEAARIMKSPTIRGVTFTGSTRGGREIGKVAGEALKKTVLELGGSDAYIILPDADLTKAAKSCAMGRMINNGQSCIAAKRFIAHRDVFQEFKALLKSELEKFQSAPLAHSKFQSQLQKQVELMQNLGGNIELGGKIPQGAGAFYPPTMISFEKNNAAIHEEEFFGPVALVLRAENVDEAFVMANSSPFGLGGGIFSADVEAAQKLVSENMEAGFVVINDFVKSDARLPFGGVKDSGHGRELSAFGFHEFCNIKTVARGE